MSIQDADRSINFAPGPSKLPDEVLSIIHSELFNYQGSGVSILELSHRSALFENIINRSKQKLRQILNIPDNYKIIFLAGGAQLQFSAVCMNFANGYDRANYLITGSWSKRAFDFASRYLPNNHVVNHCNENSVEDSQNWDIQSGAYFYYCANETINSIAVNRLDNHCIEKIDSFGMPIIRDMTSNILSYPIDIKQYGMIFASAQKNLGVAGITLLIIRDDLLSRTPLTCTPEILNYNLQVQNNSCANTTCVFAIYVLELMLDWFIKKGGFVYFDKLNKERALLIYNVIDQDSDFYICEVNKINRSNNNITFNLPTKDLEEKFLEDAKKGGFLSLKGHKLRGGIRVSMYNAMTLEECRKLADFMVDFIDKNR